MGERIRNPKVLIVSANALAVRSQLVESFAHVSFATVTQPEHLRETLAEFQPGIVLSMKKHQFPGKYHQPLSAHASVQWLEVGGSGYEHLWPWKPDLLVTNCQGVLAGALAETVVGAMLAINSNLIRYAHQQLQRSWMPQQFRPLSEQTLLLVGFGHTAQAVAARARDLGMRVLAIRNRPEPSPLADGVFGPDALPALLGQADILSLHVRLTEQTRHLIGRRELASLRPSAIVINTSRGGVVDEQALYEALEGGTVRGAYLDVFEQEPLPADSPWWSVPHVLISPHTADHVIDMVEKITDSFARNLRRWLTGQPLRNQVHVP